MEAHKADLMATPSIEDIVNVSLGVDGSHHTTWFDSDAYGCSVVSRKSPVWVGPEFVSM